MALENEALLKMSNFAKMLKKAVNVLILLTVCA